MLTIIKGMHSQLLSSRIRTLEESRCHKASERLLLIRYSTRARNSSNSAHIDSKKRKLRIHPEELYRGVSPVKAQLINERELVCNRSLKSIQIHWGARGYWHIKVVDCSIIFINEVTISSVCLSLLISQASDLPTRSPWLFVIRHSKEAGRYSLLHKLHLICMVSVRATFDDWISLLATSTFSSLGRSSYSWNPCFKSITYFILWHQVLHCFYREL